MTAQVVKSGAVKQSKNRVNSYVLHTFVGLGARMEVPLVGAKIYYVPGHGLLYKWTELLYLTCPHEADLLTLIKSQKLTQYF